MLVRVLSYSRNGYSEDFLVYVRNPGGLVLVLVLCLNTTKVMMEAARLVEEDGGEVDVSVGCKAEGKSTAVPQ